MAIGGLDLRGRDARRTSDVPADVRRVAWARAIRWFGWGFGETLLPIFILGFTTSLAQAGLISSAYDLVFLGSVIVVGSLADSFPGKSLIFLDLLLYPLIGVGYYFAGALGLVSLVILGRALNGLTYCLDTVGVDTYIRRFAKKESIATAFGYVASLANASWLTAALLGAYLVRLIPVYNLLFLITPFSLLAILPLSRAKRDRPTGGRATLSLTRFVSELKAIDSGLRSAISLSFAFEFASVASTFFIPIAAYRGGAGLPGVALLCVISAVPSLFEFWLAQFIDGESEKRRRSLIVAVGSLPPLLFAAAFVTAWSARVVVALGIELAAVFGGLALQSYATAISRPARFGETSSVLEGASTLGDLAAPVIIGVVADARGLPITFALSAVLFLVVGLTSVRSVTRSR